MERAKKISHEAHLLSPAYAASAQRHSFHDLPNAILFQSSVHRVASRALQTDGRRRRQSTCHCRPVAKSCAGTGGPLAIGLWPRAHSATLTHTDTTSEIKSAERLWPPCMQAQESVSRANAPHHRLIIATRISYLNCATASFAAASMKKIFLAFLHILPLLQLQQQQQEKQKKLLYTRVEFSKQPLFTRHSR